MKLTKDGVVREVEDAQLNKYFTAGWTAVAEQAKEEVIRLKPAVKNLATVTAGEEATNKGDE